MPGVVVIMPPAARILAASSVRAGLWSRVSSTAWLPCDTIAVAAGWLLAAAAALPKSDGAARFVSSDCASESDTMLLFAVHSIAAESPK